MGLNNKNNISFNNINYVKCYLQHNHDKEMTNTNKTYLNNIKKKRRIKQ